jgi:hypothetical protein
MLGISQMQLSYVIPLLLQITSKFTLICEIKLLTHQTAKRKLILSNMGLKSGQAAVHHVTSSTRTNH